ncbi:alkylated DNA repair protein alkB like protein 7 [Strigomonas culicis]|uniref:Alkylated DNA repair protein alkB like protein 7 n=1 Tax=Strigomonas culicis TaxID=28005 RepID=S9U8V8_9TRYP|nr:alkylated DNA repair protein alkB like protein 7 [Strigomonas culicis]EPY29558.1 alkylated DNA repair protein alkB like protein 7 [Strigomonas culicis]|eukprot:EPY25199.1 alkylated DNA repair protein alkB like protein 7 [Strigomonas culicis]
MLRATWLRRCAAQASVPASLVSMRRAPSFVQPPEEEAIGKSVKDLPAHYMTAYVRPEVITREEEAALLRYTEPWFERLEYYDGHVDGLIHHYKEFYRSYQHDVEAIAPEGDAALVRSALARIRALACHYLPAIPIDDRVHFLRLAGSGFIRSHVDNNRNSSGLIGGLCLNAARVMTLTRKDYPGEEVELLLAPRCFYAMIGRARYDWEHSVDWVVDDDEHIQRIRKSLVVEGTPIEFDGKPTPFCRHDRTAIIFRGLSPMELFNLRMHQKK